MNQALRIRDGSFHSLSRFEHGVVVAQLTETVAEAARRLRDFKVGCVVVTREGRAVGILTDRDLALRVLAEGRDPKSTTVGDIVTYDATTVSRASGIETAVRLMAEHGVRRLPITTDDGQVTGIVTADDLVVLLAQDLADLGLAIRGNVDASDTR